MLRTLSNSSRVVDEKDFSPSIKPQWSFDDTLRTEGCVDRHERRSFITNDET